MKKAIGTSKRKTMTLEQLQNRKLTKKQLNEIAALAALPDDQIDTSDIPEITSRTGWFRNPLYRPVTQPVTIRLNAPDIAVARVLSKSKGMAYQTYIKQLLHRALERELSSQPASSK
jgi:predicted DNA binding CopG/RHH family protein